MPQIHVVPLDQSLADDHGVPNMLGTEESGEVEDLGALSCVEDRWMTWYRQSSWTE